MTVTWAISIATLICGLGIGPENLTTSEARQSLVFFCPKTERGEGNEVEEESTGGWAVRRSRTTRRVGGALFHDAGSRVGDESLTAVRRLGQVRRWSGGAGSEVPGKSVEGTGEVHKL